METDRTRSRLFPRPPAGRFSVLAPPRYIARRGREGGRWSYHQHKTHKLDCNSLWPPVQRVTQCLCACVRVSVRECV